MGVTRLNGGGGQCLCPSADVTRYLASISHAGSDAIDADDEGIQQHLVAAPLSVPHAAQNLHLWRKQQHNVRRKQNVLLPYYCMMGEGPGT